MSQKFLSADQLRSSRRLPQTFPEYGMPKSNQPGETEAGEEQLNSYLNERHSCLSEGKCARLGHLLRGEYSAEENVIKIDKIIGKGVQHVGYNCTGQGRYLYPEEALYLMDCKRLEVYYKEVSLSMEEAYALLLKNTAQYDRYLVYSHLSALGYTVIRFKRRDLPAKAKPVLKPELENANVAPEESVEFSGAFNRYDRVPTTHKPHVTHASGPCLLSRHPDIVFPNTYGKSALVLTPPAPHLLPPGVGLQDSSTLDDDSSPAKRLKPSEETSAGVINSWQTYKQSLTSFQPSNPLVTPTACPLVQPSHSSSTVTILQRLRSVFGLHSNVEKPTANPLGVDYDVYLPSSLKSASVRNTPPHHRLIVVNQCDALPRPDHIKQLVDEMADDIPIHFGVVDSGNIAFYSFKHVTLQPDVLPD